MRSCTRAAGASVVDSCGPAKNSCTAIRTTSDGLMDLLAFQRQHPEWRDAVRREVLSRELVELPEIDGRLAEGQAQLTARMEQLAAKVDELAREVGRLATEMRELGAIVRRLDG